MDRLDKLPITPAIWGFLTYMMETMKITAAIISIPIITPTNPKSLSRLSINMIITQPEIYFRLGRLVYDGLPYILFVESNLQGPISRSLYSCLYQI